MRSPHRDFRLQHPAVGAALAARNAVAAEMATAGRAGLSVSEPAWGRAADAFERVQADPVAAGNRAHFLACAHDLSVRLPNVPAPESGARDANRARGTEPGWARRPLARRRRELLEMAFWFVVGGLGGLVALAAVRMLEALVAAR